MRDRFASPVEPGDEPPAKPRAKRVLIFDTEQEALDAIREIDQFRAPDGLEDYILPDEWPDEGGAVVRRPARTWAIPQQLADGRWVVSVAPRVEAAPPVKRAPRVAEVEEIELPDGTVKLMERP